MHLYTYFRLHFIVVILGFTAILGKLISIQAIDLVLYRTSIAVVSGFLFIVLFRRNARIDRKKIPVFLGVGAIIGLHWITFFHAIKVSNVSVTLACLPLSTLVTAIVEPLSQKRRISRFEVLLSILIFIGIILIFGFESHYKTGIFFSTISFVLAGLFSVINKNITSDSEPQIVNLFEMIGACVCVFLFSLYNTGLNVFSTSIALNDWVWLLILGSVCTTFAFSEIVSIMKKVSAYVVVLSINLEPVYGIILARLIFGSSEKMSLGFYFGTALITSAVFMYPLLKRMIR